MMLSKALIVEPDPATRTLIHEILATLDITYEDTESLFDARRLLAKSDHGLILPAFDMPSMPHSRLRPQNAEHFMVLLRKARRDHMPKVIMLITDRPEVGDEDKTRWAFDMRDLGVTDVVRKPLADAGRTLDRVIKKVLGLEGDEDAPRQTHPKIVHGTPQVDADGAANWPTVTDAARLLMHDLPSLDLPKARSRISTAAGRKEFEFTGERRSRRIEPHTFASWRLKQRDRDLDTEDDSAEMD